MQQTYTAVIKQSGPWWIGWIEEVPRRRLPGAHSGRPARNAETLKEALESNRREALEAAGEVFEEAPVAEEDNVRGAKYFLDLIDRHGVVFESQDFRGSSWGAKHHALSILEAASSVRSVAIYLASAPRRPCIVRHGDVQRYTTTWPPLYPLAIVRRHRPVSYGHDLDSVLHLLPGLDVEGLRRRVRVGWQHDGDTIVVMDSGVDLDARAIADLYNNQPD